MSYTIWSETADGRHHFIARTHHLDHAEMIADMFRQNHPKVIYRVLVDE